MRRAACVSSVVVALGLGLASGADAYVYWANFGANTLGRANLDGSGVNQSFVSGASGPGGMAVDGARVYWTNYYANKIGRANLDGSEVNQSFIGGLNGAYAVAVDGEHVYWTNYGGHTIGRANLDGSGVNHSFISGASSPLGVAVDEAHVYWANRSGGTIGRAKLDGSGVNQSLISGGTDLYGVAVDGAHIYWANYTGDTIGRANLDGSGVNQSFIPANGPSGVAVDGAHVYWASYDGHAIGRANLDGSGVNQSLIAGANVPNGLAVDAFEVTPPETSVTSSPADATRDRSATFVFSSSRPGSSFECRIDDAPFTACSSPALYQGLSDGRHSFAVRAIDALGLVDPTPATATWTVDTEPPTVSISSPASRAVYVRGQRVTAAYACGDPAGVRSCAGAVASGGLIDTSTLGVHDFAVTATDTLGNSRTVTASFSVSRLPSLGRVDVAHDWERLDAGAGIRFTRWRVSDLPTGVEITIRCKAKKRRACPLERRSATKRIKNGSVDLLKVVGKRRVFKSGATIEVRITKAGVIGLFVRYTVRRSKVKVQPLCLMPGSSKPRKTC